MEGGEEEEVDLEKEIEAQLGEHQESLHGLHHAIASDPNNQELLQIRAEILEAIGAAEEGLLHLKRTRLLQELDLLSDHNAQSLEVSATEGGIFETKCFLFDVGSKCRFRHSDGRWYYGQVLELLGGETARVSFLTPTNENMQICKYYQQQRCRFGSNCRMSHGFVLPTSSLRKYVEPAMQQPAIGSTVLACSSKEGFPLWRQAEVESWDEQRCRGYVVLVEDGTRLEVGMEALSLSEYAEMSDEDEDEEGSSSEEDDEEEEGEADINDDDESEGVNFAAMFGDGQARGPQTETKTFANWEQHTRGVASKIMASLGYQQGMGLGKSGQGIVEPLQGRVLPKNRSLDFIGKEDNNSQHRHHKEGEKEKGITTSSSSRKRTRGGKRKRAKKLAEAAREAKGVQERRPDVFAFINKELASEQGKRGSEEEVLSGGVSSTTNTRVKPKPPSFHNKERVSLLSQENEVKELKVRLGKLKEMAQRNLRDKAVYDAVCRKMDEARKALQEAEAVHASSHNALHAKESEKKWLKF